MIELFDYMIGYMPSVLKVPQTSRYSILLIFAATSVDFTSHLESLLLGIGVRIDEYQSKEDQEGNLQLVLVIIHFL